MRQTKGRHSRVALSSSPWTKKNMASARTSGRPGRRTAHGEALASPSEPSQSSIMSEFSTPTTSIASESPISASTKRRRLDEEFDEALESLGFEASEEEGAELSSAMKRRRGDPIILTVFMKVPRRGTAFAIGFAMQNTKEVKDDLLRVQALPGGHFQPFFINDDVLAKRAPSRGWPDWPRPAWYHSAFCTIAEVQDLKPALMAYRNCFKELGYDVELKTINVPEDDMESWRVMQPPLQYMKRVEPEHV